ncbi:unnamed protein product, partial [Iphiclides podalirius]
MIRSDEGRAVDAGKPCREGGWYCGNVQRDVPRTRLAPLILYTLPAARLIAKPLTSRTRRMNSSNNSAAKVCHVALREAASPARFGKCRRVFSSNMVF